MHVLEDTDFFMWRQQEKAIKMQLQKGLLRPQLKKQRPNKLLTNREPGTLITKKTATAMA